MDGVVMDMLTDCSNAEDLRFEIKRDGGFCKILLENRSSELIRIGLVRIPFHEFSVSDAGVRKAWVQPETMCGVIGFQPVSDGLQSYGCIGLPGTVETPARLIGVLDLRRVTAWVELRQYPDRFVPVAVFDLDDVELAAGQSRKLPAIVMLEGENLSCLFEQYGKISGGVMGARVLSEPVYGWCSWYHYYGHETECDVLKNAVELKKEEVLPAGSVIQIDDGWNRSNGDVPRNWGDWMPGEKFPRGMKAVAGDLHALGFRAGLWLAPFSADAASDLVRNHPEWILENSVDGLLEEGENPVRGLDLTHPEVLQFIDEIFERVFNEWGFDYVKLDFLMHAMAKGTRYDSSVTRAEAMHEALQSIRRIAGDRIVLCCGSPFGPAVGAADAMRVGFDVGSRWHAPMLTDIWPYGNCSIKPAAYSLIYSRWMNGNWWSNDPDCLVVRDRANQWETMEFNVQHPGGWVPENEFGLNEEEAGFWARLVYVTKTFFILSEAWDELSDVCRDLVMKSFYSQSIPFEQMDLLNEQVIMLRSSDPFSVAFFNLSDQVFCCADLVEGLPGEYTELFSHETIKVSETGGFPDLLPHSGRIWALKV